MDDLFSAAGIDLPGLLCPQTHRTKAAKPKTDERAATGRLVGARRYRTAPRGRIGPARHIGAADVLAFPLNRNLRVVSQMSKRIPLIYSAELASICNREARKLEKRLIYKGVNKQSARICAMDLLHEVYMKRVLEAERGS